MKVDRPNTEHIEGANSGLTESVKKRGKISQKDIASPDKVSRDELGSAKVKLSDRAQDMKKIKSAVDAAPEADEAKIAKFKSLIANGQYKVDSKAVADKMVDEHAYNDFFNGGEE
jgi:flagellar biosynthesis anti-sigma factor FlgM